MPAALIYVSEPVHLQLLSIKLYNIPPIVRLLPLSALPRPVSRTRTRHTRSSCTGSKGESGKAGGGGEGGGKRDQRGGVQQIGGEMEKWHAEKGGETLEERG